VIFDKRWSPGRKDTAARQVCDGTLTSTNMIDTNSPLRRPALPAVLLALLAAIVAPDARGGVRFQPVAAPPGADTSALAPDGGTLWAGTSRGVWQLSAGAFVFDGLSGRKILSLAVSDSFVWAATGDGLWKRGADGVWSKETLPGSPSLVNAVFFDGASLWAGGDTVLKRTGGVWSALPSPGGIVVSFAAFSGDVVAGRATNGAVRYSGAAATPLVAGMGPGEGAQALAVLGGTLWAGTSLGVYSWTGAAWSLDLAFGVHDVRALAVAGGALHAATFDAGVFKKSGPDWSALNGGLSIASAKSLALLGSDLYAGTSGGPVYRLLGSSWTDAGSGLYASVVSDAVTVTTQPGAETHAIVAAAGAGVVDLGDPVPLNLLPPGCGGALAVADLAPPTGRSLLVATNCGPLAGASFSPAAAGLPAGVNPTSLAPTSAGDIAAGTSSAGIYRFSSGSWTSDNAGLSPNASVFTIRQVGAELLAGAGLGVVRRGSGGSWDDSSQGLPFGAAVASLGGPGTPMGPAFAGLLGGGVYRRDGFVWRKDSVGLTSASIFSIDLAGPLWSAAGTAGVARKQAGTWQPETAGLPKGADARVVRAGPGNTLLLGTAGNGLFTAATEPYTEALPVVLDVTGGTGVRFRTELTIGNRGPDAVVSVTFQPAPGFGPASAGGTVPVSIPSGTEIRAADALAFLRALGLEIPSATPASPIAGSLTFSADAGGAPSPATSGLYAYARSFAPGAAGGSYGVFLDGTSDLDAAEDEAYVYGLRTVSGVSRSNLAATHLAGVSGDPITLEVQVYAASGAPAGTVLSRTLVPGEWFQWNGVLERAGLPDGAYGYARIRRVAGTGPFLAYGVVNDAETSDGAILPMFRPGGRSAARKLIVPVVVDAFGEAGSHFTTELTLANDGLISTPVDLVYRPAPGFGSATGAAVVTVSLLAYQQTTIPNIIQYLRDHGVSIPDPATGGPQAGTLAVTFRSLQSLDSPRTVALARTSTPNPDGATGGTFGVSYSAVPSGGGARTTAVVPGLAQDATVRSNLAVLYAGGGSGGPIGLSVVLHDAATGATAGVPLSLTLNAGDWFQWTKVLEKAGAAPGTTKAYAVITRTSGDDTFFAYGVLNDAVTSDGSYLAMIPSAEY